MIKIVTQKKHGTRRTVESSTLNSLRDGILDLRYDDVKQTIYAINDDGVSTIVLSIVIADPDAKNDEFKLYDGKGDLIG